MLSARKFDDIPLLVDEQAKSAGFDLPKREHQFYPSRKWRVDYFWRPWAIGGLALEVEGGVWTGGRHTRGSGFVKDMEKYNTLTTLGIHLLRLTPQQVRKGELQAWLERMK